MSSIKQTVEQNEIQNDIRKEKKFGQKKALTCGERINEQESPYPPKEELEHDDQLHLDMSNIDYDDDEYDEDVDINFNEVEAIDIDSINHNMLAASPAYNMSAASVNIITDDDFHHGMLQKRQPKLLKQWQKRFFVLDTKILKYYKTQ